MMPHTPYFTLKKPLAPVAVPQLQAAAKQAGNQQQQKQVI
jgi:hypothetical protein